MTDHKYEHAVFPVGTPVYILPSIRDEYPESPIAEMNGVVVTGMYYDNLAWFDDPLTKVPVFINGQVWKVKQKYVVREATWIPRMQ